MKPTGALLSVAAQGSATRGRGSDNQINLSQQWETDRLQQGRKKGETDHTLGVIAAKSGEHGIMHSTGRYWGGGGSAL